MARLQYPSSHHAACCNILGKQFPQATYLLFPTLIQRCSVIRKHGCPESPETYTNATVGAAEGRRNKRWIWRGMISMLESWRSPSNFTRVWLSSHLSSSGRWIFSFGKSNRFVNQSNYVEKAETGFFSFRPLSLSHRLITWFPRWLCSLTCSIKILKNLADIFSAIRTLLTWGWQCTCIRDIHDSILRVSRESDASMSNSLISPRRWTFLG